jgi:hypothetical protein
MLKEAIITDIIIKDLDGNPSHLVEPLIDELKEMAIHELIIVNLLLYNKSLKKVIKKINITNLVSFRAIRIAKRIDIIRSIRSAEEKGFYSLVEHKTNELKFWTEALN